MFFIICSKYTEKCDQYFMIESSSTGILWQLCLLSYRMKVDMVNHGYNVHLKEDAAPVLCQEMKMQKGYSPIANLIQS